MKKKKRKLTPTDQIPDMDLGEPVDNKLVRSDDFKGVVWRNSNHTSGKRGELYEPGQGEVVALLKNWREVFKSSQPRSDRRTQIAGQGIESGKHGKQAKARVPGKKENMHDADSDERLEDEVTQTLTPPPFSLSTSEEQAGPSRKAGTKGGSKLNNVMSASDAPTDSKPNRATLPTRQSQPISPSSDAPSQKGEFLSHVEVGNGSNELLPEAPQPATRRKRKASVSLDEEEEDTASVGSNNTNSTTRSKSKRLATKRKLDGDEDIAPRVTRTSSSSASSSRGRPRGRGRGKRS